MCVTLHMFHTLLNAIVVILLRPGSDEILNPLQFVILVEVVTKGLSRRLLLYFEELMLTIVVMGVCAYTHTHTHTHTHT